jgi:hypothetical protein
MPGVLPGAPPPPPPPSAVSSSSSFQCPKPCASGVSARTDTAPSRAHNAGDLSHPVLGFHDVTFGYTEGHILYKDLDFGLDLKSRIALVWRHHRVGRGRFLPRRDFRYFRLCFTGVGQSAL